MKTYISSLDNDAAPVCRIFGAGDFCEDAAVGGNDFVVAADGGYSHVKNLGLKPDLLVGDFDSLDGPPSGVNVLRLSVQKDDTDMFYAAKEGLKRGYRLFALYGGLGGKRPSHVLANVALLAWLCERDAQGFLLNGDVKITAIKDGKIEFAKELIGNASVFAYGGDAENVTIAGLKYEIDKITLTSQFPLGVSNSFIGKAASVAVKKGSLIIVLD